MSSIRGTHSTPGVYTQINDISVAAQSLGITTLGLVGETLKGPAFEPIAIADWDQYKAYFGGTSTEKFRDSQYPKYELPYIAKSYLSASRQLYVCRVLGLSGYNAGPAFLIKATKEGTSADEYVIGVLRSRGTYSKYGTISDRCNGYQGYDVLSFKCANVEIQNYVDLTTSIKCNNGSQSLNATGGSKSDKISVDASNLGSFTIICKDSDNKEIGRYPVSLNPGSKNYIYKVIGGKVEDSDAAVYVEELYDVFLSEKVASGDITKIVNGTLPKAEQIDVTAVHDPIADFVTIPVQDLKSRNVGQVFLATVAGSSDNGFSYYATDLSDGKTIATSQSPMSVGHLYEVVSRKKQDGTTEYIYTNVIKPTLETALIEKQAQSLTSSVAKTSGTTKDTGDSTTTPTTPDRINSYEDVAIGKVTGNAVNAVKITKYDSYFCIGSDNKVDKVYSFSDYHESFRCASTPWIVSELKGSGKDYEVKKLFRFHTITDGNAANTQIKISIANIRPDDGTFDVYIRDYNDSDSAPVVLESYRGLTMVPGTSKYIGRKIGTLDGTYEAVSRYVTVEVIENNITQDCVPAGFLGYPIRSYSSVNASLKSPSVEYNTVYNEDIKDRKQYFGMSDIKGVDVDVLNYKGKSFYTGNYSTDYSRPFHLDSTVNKDVRSKIGGVKVTIDGDQSTADLDWDTVSAQYTNRPVIGSEEDMEGTIFENVKLRKFTVYPYGGFDGWDIFRGSRTNTDEFRENKYKGTVGSSKTAAFDKLGSTDMLGLKGTAISSDYYAYLAGIRQFALPEMYPINLFATPGIDYVNNEALVNEAISMIEDDRFGDSFYVVTTPDMPFGTSDAESEDMYTPTDVADNLDDSGIDTYYASTYYPWIKFFDKENNRYIYLPATKDVLRDMANVDNKKFPWFAPAGMERGTVEAKRLRFFAKNDDEDTVYSGRINPVKKFSADGIKIWGNKTLYTRDTPMNRVNTVRLVIYMRKLIVAASNKLVFDPDDNTLEKQFTNTIRPILVDIQNGRGFTAFRLATSRTAEQMDAHEFSASVKIKPTPTAEYFNISFDVTPQGVSFDEIE